MARTKNAPVPEVGAEAPEFNLPSAQGGSLRLGMRTVRGPVIVAFFRGMWSEEDVEFFRSLAGKEDEINAALGSVVGVCAAEPAAAREFQRTVGMKSYLLYDYTKTVTAAWGVLENDPEHGPQARPTTFLVDREGKISASWTENRPSADELLAAVSAITGLPKPEEPEEVEEGGKEAEKPARRTARKAGAASDGEAEAKETTGEADADAAREERRARREARRKEKEAEEGSGE